MKIVEYKIIYESNVVFLEEEVNKLIKDGWQPLGSFVIESYIKMPDPDETRQPFHQVMVKYE